jgi:hypothetical protein
MLLPADRSRARRGARGRGRRRHPITVHPIRRPASSSWIHDEPWLSFNTLQTFKSDFLNYRMVAADVARAPAKPAVNGEARYEEEGGTTALQVRRGAWWSVLAGGFYTYGHGGNWQKPGDWKRWIESPGARQMTILREFFESLDWWTLVPDAAILAGDATDIVAARASDRSWALVYVPSRRTISLRRSALPSGVDAAWMNPATGRSEFLGEVPATESPSFTPPEAGRTRCWSSAGGTSSSEFPALFRRVGDVRLWVPVSPSSWPVCSPRRLTSAPTGRTASFPEDRVADWRPGLSVGVPGGIPSNRTTLIDVTKPPFNATPAARTTRSPPSRRPSRRPRRTRSSISRPGLIGSTAPSGWAPRVASRFGAPDPTKPS